MLWKFIFFKLVSLVQLSKYTLHTLWCRQNIPLLLYLYFLLFFPLHPPLTFRLKITQNTQGEKEREKNPLPRDNKRWGRDSYLAKHRRTMGGGATIPSLLEQFVKDFTKRLNFYQYLPPPQSRPSPFKFLCTPRWPGLWGRGGRIEYGMEVYDRSLNNSYNHEKCHSHIFPHIILLLGM